jgi:flagellar basal-body rod modification protein FlgD
MTTNPVASTTPTSTTSQKTSSPGLSLTSSDFVHMMITQLQNQDPLNPTNTGDLMSEMSQIGQLQSTAQLQTTLQGLATQTQIGAASSLMGKQVTGLDSTSNPVSGVVSSIQVTSSGVDLRLQNGSQLALSNVSTISPAPATSGS